MLINEMFESIVWHDKALSVMQTAVSLIHDVSVDFVSVIYFVSQQAAKANMLTYDTTVENLYLSFPALARKFLVYLCSFESILSL